jgi:hypothetical protein
MVNPVGRSSSTINRLAKRLGLDVANTTSAFVRLGAYHCFGSLRTLFEEIQ